MMVQDHSSEYRRGNVWLFIRVEDKYATSKDIMLKDKSVVSKRTIEQIASDKNSHMAKQPKRNKQYSRKSKAGSTAGFKDGIKGAMPGTIAPMLCTLTKDVIDDKNYLYEIKWDGYRIISYVNSGNVRLDSRSALDYTRKYPPIVEALKDTRP